MVKYVPLETIKTEYVTQTDTLVQRDSVWTHDSIYVHEWMQGDTIYIDRDRYSDRVVLSVMGDRIREYDLHPGSARPSD